MQQLKQVRLCQILNFIIYLIMILASVVLTENATDLNDKQRWQACRAVARDYPAYGYLHTHQKQSLGGKFAPHTHLFIALPVERAELWKAGAKADLARRFASSLIELSDPDSWVFDPDSPVSLLRYAAGQGRWFTPSPVYWTHSRYQKEQRALDGLLAQALKSRAA